MGKKKFKETKFGKIITGKIVAGAVKLIPFGIGSLAGNILDENGTESGEIDKKTIYPQLIKLAFYATIGLLIAFGKISPEYGEIVKDFLD